MNALKPVLPQFSANGWTERVRHFLSGRLIGRVSAFHGLSDIFRQSQSWFGYDHAYDCWHSAYWRWVDDETPAQAVQQWNAFQFNCSNMTSGDIVTHIGADGIELPPDEDERKQWIKEYFGQEYFQCLSIFKLAMGGPSATDPESIKSFAAQMYIARKIGDAAYSEQLARQPQRTPCQDKGGRRLPPLLLVHWIPCCLWAFTNEGIAAFLNHLSASPDSEPYRSQAISQTHHKLKLYHAPKPFYWGFAGTPLYLLPLSQRVLFPN
jgi:hypothetical protein